MQENEGIPAHIIKELKLKKAKKIVFKSKIIKETHQVRISLPSLLTKEIDFDKFNEYCVTSYMPEQEQIIIQLIKKDKNNDTNKNASN